VIYSVIFIERRGVDDPCGAISVHGVNGSGASSPSGSSRTATTAPGWNGVVRDAMVQKFGADGVRGLLYGDFSQFLAQALGLRRRGGVRLRDGVGVVQALGQDHAAPRREEVEREGLDIRRSGPPAYPDFAMRSGSF